jgi:hypothetical protein
MPAPEGTYEHFPVHADRELSQRLPGHRRIARGAAAPPTQPAAECRPSGAVAFAGHPSGPIATFRLLAPKAIEVTLNGSWDGGTNLKMTKDEAGVWSTTIGPLAPPALGLLVHGRRREGARSTTRKRSATGALRQPC